MVSRLKINFIKINREVIKEGKVLNNFKYI